MRKKYLVLSDFIISRNDGDKHFISCARLCHLYGVNPRECIFGQMGDGKRYPNLPILAPRYDGNYILPDIKPKPDKKDEMKKLTPWEIGQDVIAAYDEICERKSDKSNRTKAHKALSDAADILADYFNKYHVESHGFGLGRSRKRKPQAGK